jgi:hypothetical protein
MPAVFLRKRLAGSTKVTSKSLESFFLFEMTLVAFAISLTFVLLGVAIIQIVRLGQGGMINIILLTVWILLIVFAIGYWVLYPLFRAVLAG